MGQHRQGEKIEFWRYDFRNVYQVLYLLFAIIILALGIAMLAKWDSTFILVLGLLFAIVPLYLGYMVAVSRIVIDEEQIIMTTPFRKVSIRFDQVKCFGVFGVTDTIYTEISYDRANKFYFWSRKNIYLATVRDWRTYFFYAPDDHITTHFSKEKYGLIKSRLEALGKEMSTMSTDYRA